MTLEELKVIIAAETEPLKKGISDVKKQMSGLQNETTKATSGIKSAFKKLVAGIIALRVGQKIGRAIAGGIKEAINVEAAIQQIKRIMGESTNQFLKWAQTQAIAFNMSKGEALKYGAVFGNLISGFAKSSQEAMGYTTDLLKASSVIASATGRSMQDVMERIRSGLLGNTEAIEDLGVNVNIAMIESTEAFKKFANGRTWNQIDFQTQQQIRLMAILEQTTKKYGDAVNQNTSSQLQQLVANLKNVQLSLGQAFLPIIKIVIPMLNILAQKLSYITGVTAQFSQALFGKTAQMGNKQAQNTQAQAKSMTNLGNATEKAGKQAKGALAGFDEINGLQLSDGTANADATPADTSSIAIPGLDTGSFLDSTVEVSQKVKETADSVKARFGEMTSFISRNKDVILSALSGIIAGFATFKIITNWTTIVKTFNNALTTLGSAMSAISWPVVAVSAAIALLVGNVVYLWKTNEGFRNSIIEVWNQIKYAVTTIAKDTWAIIKDIWVEYGQTLINNLSGFMTSIQNLILAIWEGFLKPIITGALEMLSWLWREHLSGLVAQVGEFVMKLFNGALEIYNGFIAPIVNWMAKTFGPIIADVIKFSINRFGSLLAGVIDVAKGLFRALGGIIDFIAGIFTGNWKKAWEGVKNIFKGIFDSLYGFVKVPLNLIIDAINFVIRGLNKISIDIPDWVSKITGVSGTWGINIPVIPKLAKGGITNGPTLAMIGDNLGGKEVVSPLDKLQDMIASAVGTAVMSAIQFNEGNRQQNGDIIIQLDGTTLARILNPYSEKESARIGTPMIVTT